MKTKKRRKSIKARKDNFIYPKKKDKKVFRSQSKKTNKTNPLTFRQRFTFSLNENFKQALKDLKLIKSYFIFSVVLFLVITLIGAVFPIFFQEQILKLLKEIMEQTQGLDSLELTQFIMFNNLKSSLIALVLGIFFGIIPLGVTVVNAYVLGFVINKSVMIEGPLIIWRLFPHGIFELPAILISISLGLRLGLFLFIYQGKNRGKEFWKWIIQSIRIFILIIMPLLVIAGIIEGLLIGVLS